MNEPGILAIFNDCRPGREAEFEAWFQGEHLIERLAVPGFLFGRRFSSMLIFACRRHCDRLLMLP